MTDDETRIMPVPDEVRRLMVGGTPEDEAETPCVGVSSVGDTHFGETRTVKVQSGPRDLSKNPSVSLQASPHQQGERDNTRPTRAQAHLRRPIPRSVALLLGTMLGVGSALFFLFALRPNGQGAQALSSKTRVRVDVRSSEGGGLGDVPVQVENQVVITEGSGEAFFSEVDVEGALDVVARCPAEYSGADLVREIPWSVLKGAALWEFELSCQPDFMDVTIEVAVEGCGEMRAWMDGAEVGTTREGKLLLGRRIGGDVVVEIRVDPLDDRCRIDPVRHVSLSPKQEVTRVVFQGERIAPVRRRSTHPRNTSTSSRPYRL